MVFTHSDWIRCVQQGDCESDRQANDREHHEKDPKPVPSVLIGGVVLGVAFLSATFLLCCIFSGVVFSGVVFSGVRARHGFPLVSRFLPNPDFGPLGEGTQDQREKPSETGGDEDHRTSWGRACSTPLPKNNAGLSAGRPLR